MTAKKKSSAKGRGGKATEETPTLSFEEALERLEAIVSRMEDGEVPLEESLEAYAEGTRLARLCLERLERADAMIKELSEDAGGFRLEKALLGDEDEAETEEDDDREAGRDELF